MANELVQTLLVLANDKSTIPVHKKLVDFTSSLEAGMMLSQLLYWAPRTKNDEGWIAKSDKEFHDELCLTKYAVRSAKEILEALKIVKTKLKKFRGSPTVHYQVDLDVLGTCWNEFINDPAAWEKGISEKVDFAKSQKQILRNRKMEIAKSQRLLTETRTETSIDMPSSSDEGAPPEPEQAKTDIPQTAETELPIESSEPEKSTIIPPLVPPAWPAPKPTNNPQSTHNTQAVKKGDVFDGIFDTLAKANDPQTIIAGKVLQFPPDVQSTLTELIRLYHWPPGAIPARPRIQSKGGEFALWIKELQKINRIIAGYGVEALELSVEPCKGLSISRPGSITWCLAGEVGKLAARQEVQAVQDHDEEEAVYRPPSPELAAYWEKRLQGRLHVIPE